METWLLTLPQSPLINGYTSNRVPNQTNFQTDVGPAKTRRRSTAVPIMVKENYVLTTAQKISLENFYSVALKDGSDAFVKPNPETGTTSVYKFVNPPVFNTAGIYWTTTLELEIQP